MDLNKPLKFQINHFLETEMGVGGMRSLGQTELREGLWKLIEHTNLLPQGPHQKWGLGRVSLLAAPPTPARVPEFLKTNRKSCPSQFVFNHITQWFSKYFVPRTTLLK